MMLISLVLMGLLPKCHALQRLLRQIDRMRCLNTTLFALLSERRCCRVVKAAEKQRENAAEFLGLIFRQANSYSMLLSLGSNY